MAMTLEELRRMEMYYPDDYAAMVAEQQRGGVAPENQASISTPEGLASLAKGLGDSYGPVHEQAVRIAWGLDSGANASPEVLQRLADIRAGKYNTVNGPHPLMKLGFAAIMGAGGLSALGASGAGATGGASTAATGGTLGTGIVPGAGGATGLTVGTAGTGLSTAGAAGTSLAPGFFTAESLYPVVGGLSAATKAAGALPNDGGLSASDLTRAIPGVLGAFAANEQAGAYGDQARELMAIGAPSRERFEASFAPGFDVAGLPGVRESMDAAGNTLMRKLSATGGNPIGNPGGIAEAQNFITGNVALPALNEYRRLNAGTGGLAALTSAAPGAASNEIKAGGGVFDALGGAAADVLNPPKSLADILKEIDAARRASGNVVSLV